MMKSCKLPFLDENEYQGTERVPTVTGQNRVNYMNNSVIHRHRVLVKNSCLSPSLLLGLRFKQIHIKSRIIRFGSMWIRRANAYYVASNNTESVSLRLFILGTCLELSVSREVQDINYIFRKG